MPLYPLAVWLPRQRSKHSEQAESNKSPGQSHTFGGALAPAGRAFRQVPAPSAVGVIVAVAFAHTNNSRDLIRHPSNIRYTRAQGEI